MLLALVEFFTRPHYKKHGWRFVPFYGYVRGDKRIWGVGGPGSFFYYSIGRRHTFIFQEMLASGFALYLKDVSAWHTSDGDETMSEEERTSIAKDFLEVFGQVEVVR